MDDDRGAQRPTLAEQIDECCRLLAGFDDTPWPRMDALFYQQGYEELSINLRLLLELIDDGRHGSGGVAQ
ncbi:hypothetical protein [Microbacterium lacticum]